MNVYVCRGERLVVSEPAADQDDDELLRCSLESSGTLVVYVGDPMREDKPGARIYVTREGRVFAVVFDENGGQRRSYDLDAVNGNITNRWEAK